MEEGRGSLDLGGIVLAEVDQNLGRVVEVGSSWGIDGGEDDPEDGRMIRRGSGAVLEKDLASKSSGDLTLAYCDLNKVMEMCCERSLQSEGRQRKYRHRFAHSDQVCD